MSDFLVAQLAHWPFIAAMFCLAAIGQVAKNTFWTEENARVSKFYSFGRKTLPIHPVFLGVFLGVLIHGMPVSPGVEGTSARALYFAFAGVASTWLFSLIKSWAKKEGYEIQLPGESFPPKDGGDAK